MESFLVPMALAILFEALKSVVKNPKSKAQMKSACLKLRNAINAAYFGDVDFQ